jgi:hypothetical protein
MLPFPDTAYARLRLDPGAVPLLREHGASPPERVLQAIWLHQRLKRDELRSLDGQPIRILHPGFLSREGGPDFCGAVIQFGPAPARMGDVEVDIRAGGWTAHGHDRNPAFRNVILHVIWESGRPVCGAPPELAISDKLDAPLGELRLWLDSDLAGDMPDRFRGRCCRVLGELSAEKRGELLRDAAAVRLSGKGAQFQARARQAGWEQSLWEGLFGALGYKHNSWPMRRLAESRSRWDAPPATALQVQARLLGMAGLLPADLTRARASADGYVRRLWDQWWREQEEFADCALPASVWRFHGQRAANHPQRRLALAAHWVAAGGLVAKIERWCAEDACRSGRSAAASLLDVLRVDGDEFWSWHWTLRSARTSRPLPLLGPARATDLAVNVILPWIWIRAVEGRNADVQRAVEERYQGWPAAQDNAVLRLARERLWGGASRRAFRGAVEQQGCLQISRDFCNRSDAACRDCGFPRFVREFAGSDAVGLKG